MAHSAGTSDGQARIEVIDPGAVTGHNYKVTFEDDGAGTLLWNVTDLTTSNKILWILTGSNFLIQVIRLQMV